MGYYRALKALGSILTIVKSNGMYQLLARISGAHNRMTLLITS
jgi:hypothetical protein